MPAPHAGALGLPARRDIAAKLRGQGLGRGAGTLRFGGRVRERRFRVCEEAPGFRPGPRVMTCAQARGDRDVLSIVDFPLATFCGQGRWQRGGLVT